MRTYVSQIAALLVQFFVHLAYMFCCSCHLNVQFCRFFKKYMYLTGCMLVSWLKTTWRQTVISQFYLTELRVTHYMYISHKIEEEGLFLPYMSMYVPKGMKSLIKLFRVQDCQ